MKPSLPPLALSILLSSPLLSAGEPLFTDPFTEFDKVPERRAIRGEWEISEGVAAVTQDDKLYKDYNNHGPILFYDVPTGNATFEYTVKPIGCETVVFTLNSKDGHVFRFVTSGKGTNFRAFPPDGETKSIATHAEPDWVLTDNEWTSFKIVVQGAQVTVTFGSHEPIVIEHETYAQAKDNFSVGFAFGSLAVKGISVTAE